MNNQSLELTNEYLRALHIGEVAFAYYQVRRSAPSEQDYHNWANALPDALKNHYQTVGFADGRNNLDFRRYFLQIRNKEMIAYMETNLSTEDFILWQEMRDRPGNL
jgi:hypothetical protein